MTAGAVGYEWRRFTSFGLVAAVTWATYAALVGFVGGAAFEHDVVMALLLGLGLAAAVTAATELVVASWAAGGRYLPRGARRARRRAAELRVQRDDFADLCSDGSAAETDLVSVGVAVGDLADAVGVGLALGGADSAGGDL